MREKERGKGKGEGEEEEKEKEGQRQLWTTRYIFAIVLKYTRFTKRNHNLFGLELELRNELSSTRFHVRQ